MWPSKKEDESGPGRHVGHILFATDVYGDLAQRPLDRSERAYLVSVIRECDGAVVEAATRMGISRQTLWEKMKRHGLDPRQLENERVT